ncbi:TIGR04255 family protein [Trebonia sp.]|uniref:TIGR04255 family protein n=1 Tax=Trebonia sp. TaxID=2767075 RepID=UPI0026237B5A|nr:TIGR04255 family protein [Trebonia sp.]
MFRLDAAPRYRLARPPLNQALVDVRFPVQAGLATMEGIAPVQQQLNTLFPYLKQQQVQQVSLVMGPGIPAAAGAQASPVWRFEDDSGWSLVLAPGSAVLSVGPQYSGFGEFSERLSAVLQALSNSAGVTRADRLGVRYLNIVEVPPDDEGAWRRWFRPELTGWSGTILDGPTRLITSLTQTQLAAPPLGELSGPPVDVQALVRHGVIPAGTVVPGVVPVQPQRSAYLIDIDVFVEAPQPFDPKELSRQVTSFHGQIDRFFYWAMTDEGAEYFGKEVDDAAGNSL